MFNAIRDDDRKKERERERERERENLFSRRKEFSKVEEPRWVEG